MIDETTMATMMLARGYQDFRGDGCPREPMDASKFDSKPGATVIRRRWTLETIENDGGRDFPVLLERTA